MTTHPPAGDGDTRPTDRERLTGLVAGLLCRERHQRPANAKACVNCESVATHVYAEPIDALLAARAPAPPDAAQALRDAEVWDEASEAVMEWAANNPGPSGIPHDPPTNPYADRLAAEPDAATRTGYLLILNHAEPSETDLPRRLGLFATREAAWAWSEAHPTDGDREVWPVTTLTPAGGRAPVTSPSDDGSEREVAAAPPAGSPDAATRTMQVERLREAAVVNHKGPNDTDAAIMRRTARDLRGGYDAGGSNRRAAVARVLDVVADLIEPAAADPGTRGEGDDRG